MSSAEASKVLLSAVIASGAATMALALSATAWAASVEHDSETTDNIEINSASHLGLGFHPLVWYAVGDRLAQSEDHWQKFAPPLPESWLFPRQRAPR